MATPLAAAEAKSTWVEPYLISKVTRSTVDVAPLSCPAACASTNRGGERSTRIIGVGALSTACSTLAWPNNAGVATSVAPASVDNPPTSGGNTAPPPPHLEAMLPCGDGTARSMRAFLGAIPRVET